MSKCKLKLLYLSNFYARTLDYTSNVILFPMIFSRNHYSTQSSLWARHRSEAIRSGCPTLAFCGSTLNISSAVGQYITAKWPCFHLFSGLCAWVSFLTIRCFEWEWWGSGVLCAAPQNYRPQDKYTGQQLAYQTFLQFTVLFLPSFLCGRHSGLCRP